MFKKIAVAAMSLMLCIVFSGHVYAAEETEAASIEAASSAVAENDTVAEGEYQVNVTLGGGSGKATVVSPCSLSVKADGTMTASIEWSSPFYDYMIVNEEKYEPVNTEGNSVFEIPVAALDEEIPVIADTTAMSEPHEIAYTLTFESPKEAGEIFFSDLKSTGSMELSYAEGFSVDYYEGDYALISIVEGDRFLVVPEDAEIPEGLDEDIIPLKQPLSDIYLAATACMDYFAALDGCDAVTLSGTEEDGWYVEAARQAMEEGKMLYAGKYSAPDYELILSKKCSLAIESTMIYHSPEVKEKLEEFGIPVLVDRSSYEAHPLGRVEWIKLYSVLLGKEELAETLFEEQASQVKELESKENTGKTVAFFYITSSGYANVRKPGDYVSEMIGLAGGNYIFKDLDMGDDSSLSTMNMGLEDFYANAKDADYIIYNSTIDGELKSIDELMGKSALLKDFKAVKDGNVWCLTKSMFQDTTCLGDVIVDMHRMLTEENPSDLTYLYRLE